MTKALTVHDDFLHLGYPRDPSRPWKENYYFSYVDQQNDAMGMLHLSIHRHKGVAAIQSHNVIGGEAVSYMNVISYPEDAKHLHDDNIIVDDGQLRIAIIEAMQAHKVQLKIDDLYILLSFQKRFPPFLFPEDEFENPDMNIVHYEQSMKVDGLVRFKQRDYPISCFGKRDHTWGFRNEAGIKGWNWATFESGESSWNLTQMRHSTGKDQAGYRVTAEEQSAVTAVEISHIEKDQSGSPEVCRYKVSFDNGHKRNVTATRFKACPISDETNGVYVDENFSRFIVEETGETGIGIDEHAHTRDKGRC